jgi:site-specific DNA-methyltransferase (adenine-specific)
MKSVEFSDGLAINGDSTSQETVDFVKSYLGDLEGVPLVATDPPYGNIVMEHWDRVNTSDDEYAALMVQWTRLWSQLLLQGGAFYVWGGIGLPQFRPFIKYLTRVEDDNFKMSNLITWSKKRAYGVQNNYLFTREELAYFTKGNPKKPLKFNIPLLETKRGYAGYNEKYPAKSEFYRRTNVWMDVNEIFRGKLHPTQKPGRVVEIPIEVHTDPGDFVIDPFAGSGATAIAARKLGRKFVVIENDEKIFDGMISRL